MKPLGPIGPKSPLVPLKPLGPLGPGGPGKPVHRLHRDPYKTTQRGALCNIFIIYLFFFFLEQIEQNFESIPWNCLCLKADLVR